LSGQVIDVHPERQAQRTARPEMLVREYRHGAEYQRDAARLQRAGWEVVSILERPVPPGWLRRTTRSPVARLAPADVERLVTYVWRGRAREAPPPAVRAADRRTGDTLRWHWWVALVGLVLLLALGLLSFFGDNLLPGLLALAV
jgi:hypothetical protein